jgi:predicted RNA-binding protein with EMAP domain
LITGLNVGFLAGLGLGIAIVELTQVKKANETAEQIDERLKKELTYYRNLCDSLQQDIRYLKQTPGTNQHE